MVEIRRNSWWTSKAISGENLKELLEELQINSIKKMLKETLRSYSEGILSGTLGEFPVELWTFSRRTNEGIQRNCWRKSRRISGRKEFLDFRRKFEGISEEF